MSWISRLSPFLVLAALGLQVALPASYYLGGDPEDERFAWRMFSQRMLWSCELRVRGETARGVRPLDLKEHLLQPWRRGVANGSDAITAAVFDHLCAERADLRELHLARACVHRVSGRWTHGRVSHSCGGERPVP